jgi:uridylate kinase
MRYERILLKLSGEALMGQGTHGIDPAVIQRLAEEIHAVVARGTQVGIVVGGGNLLRGAGLASRGMNRVTGDHMGMLATAMNALALQDAIGKAGADCRVMSALAIAQVCESYGP